MKTLIVTSVLKKLKGDHLKSYAFCRRRLRGFSVVDEVAKVILSQNY